METIFDYNHTAEELNDIRFDSLSLCLKFGIDINEELTPAIYEKVISKENAYYDLACLFEFKKDSIKANYYWEKLPIEYNRNGRGFDNVQIKI